MIRFTATERRTLLLGVVLLALGTGARLLLAPDAGDFAWTASPVPGRAGSLPEARERVDDTLASVREAGRPLAPGEKLDLNRVGAVQLQRLPGVGPARAAAIVRERETNGPFASVDELTRVPGVGSGLVRRWEGALSAADGSSARTPRSPVRIDLNRALPNELEQITGIGPALARRIVEVRSRRGRFDAVEELLEVPGIGPKTLDNLRRQAFVR